MQDEFKDLEDLKQSVSKLISISELYENTIAKKIETEAQLEEARMKLKIMREQVLKLSLECKGTIERLKEKVKKI